MISDQELARIVNELRTTQRSAYKMWTFAFTPQGGKELSVTIPFNVFSAKVHASTVEDDWGDMGAVCQAIGVPAPEKCIGGWPKTIETNANATHYWRWQA